MMIVRLLSYAVIALLLAGGVTRADDALTPAQRDGVEKIIHDYILKHPEVVIEALQSAEDRDRAGAAGLSGRAVVARQKELQGDTPSPSAGNPKGDVTVVEFFDYRCP